MKNIYLVKALLFGILLVGCQQNEKEQTVEEVISTEDLVLIKERKSKIQKQADLAKKNLKQLEEAILRLDPQEKKYALVTAIEPIDTVFRHFVEVQGSVKTKNDQMISPEMGGILTQLNVTEGQFVQKGAVIGKVDDSIIQEQIAQQKIQLGLAKTTYERQKALWDKNIGTEIQYLQAKNSYEALQQGITITEKQLSKVNIYAPYSGVVEQIITKQGQVVGPGSPIIRLVGLSSLYVQADVPEDYLAQVRRGTKTLVRLDAINQEYMTTVKRINATINPQSRAFTVEVGVPKSRLVKPNLIANLKINDYTNQNALLVPSNVVSEDADGHQFLFLVENEKNGFATVKKQQVQVGRSTQDHLVEILGGITKEQRIIQEGAKNLSNDQNVQILDYSAQ